MLGIMPTRLFLQRVSSSKDVNDPILLGIVPVRLLMPKFKYVNDVSDPILVGIVPVNRELITEIDVTLSYVIDPLTAPHVTP